MFRLSGAIKFAVILCAELSPAAKLNFGGQPDLAVCIEANVIYYSIFKGLAS